MNWLLTTLVLIIGFRSISYGKSTDDLVWNERVFSYQDSPSIKKSASTPNIEILRMANGLVVALDSEAPQTPDHIYYQALPAKEKVEFTRARHQILASAANLFSQKNLPSLALFAKGKSIQLLASSESLRQENLEQIDVLNPNPAQKQSEKERLGRVRSILRSLNEAIILSTYKAARYYIENKKNLNGLTNEFGIQIALKSEFQFGLGKINITKNFPILFSFGYRKDSQEVIFRIGKRTEKMAQGSAFSAGLKVEAKVYKSISRADSHLSVQGVTWYPPAIPMISLVGDAGPKFQAGGIVVGINVADLIPGLYFVNTVNEFSDKVVFIRTLRISSLSEWVAQAKLKIGFGIKSLETSIVRCSSVFQL